MEEKEQKYIELILERCLNFEKSKILFVSYDIVNQDFVDKLAKNAKNIGVEEVYFDKKDIFAEKKLLEKINKEDIKKEKQFDCSIWDEYAKKNASFLMISSEFPQILDNIDTKIIAEASKVRMKSKPVYKRMQQDNELVWLIAVYPNKIWAKERFPELDPDEAYEKLFDLIMEVTLCNDKNPIAKWDEQLEKQKKLMEKLNKMKIKSLRFTNQKGTDLTVGIVENAIWQSAGANDNKTIVNMPSYEVFTAPDYRKTNGIVYATKPLSYNSSLIDKFWIEFKDGVVSDYDAEIGKDLLEEIINGDEGSARLGEVALVDKNSPIAKTNYVFGETCLDENASCHIALGSSFLECLKDADKMSEEERKEIGLNNSENHVDFMIGTDDLNIEAEIEKGTISIFVNGEFNIED